MIEKIAEAMFDRGSITSEGSHYLEKIIQANFDLPEPMHSQQIVNFLNFRMKEIFGCGYVGDESANMYDIVHDVVIPEMKKPKKRTQTSKYALCNLPSL